MLSTKSLRAKFALQLASAGAMLIVIFSGVLYQYTRITIYENVVLSLSKVAKEFMISEQNLELGMIEFFYPGNEKILLKVIKNSSNIKKPYFSKKVDNKQDSLILLYPIDDKFVLEVSKDITKYSEILNQIFVNLIVLNSSAIFLVLFYALFLSRMLLVPIKILSKKLSVLNENFLHEVDTNEVATEFVPLANSINKLIEKIQNFAKYQKELFIGAAHELKTPLAVMKTKNEVTLIKKREPEKYIEALKSNINSINQMNKMVTSILQIGRQESAQFEEPVKLDIIKYLRDISRDFEILANQENKHFVIDLEPTNLTINLQINLFMHIIRNFVQNAIKFSPVGGEILLKTCIEKNNFVLKVYDEGSGIDENVDLFAPFKRFGNKSGSGLGLFLAQNAAKSIGAKIFIKNRDEKGAVATFILPLNNN